MCVAPWGEYSLNRDVPPNSFQGLSSLTGQMFFTNMGYQCGVYKPDSPKPRDKVLKPVTQRVHLPI